MSHLFLISMQKTVSGGPWVEGMGSGGGQEMSHGDRESQKINLFSPKEKGGRTRLPSLGFGHQDQGSAWELETLVQVRVCAVLAVCPGSGHFFPLSLQSLISGRRGLNQFSRVQSHLSKLLSCNWGTLLPPRRHVAASADIFGGHDSGVL